MCIRDRRKDCAGVILGGAETATAGALGAIKVLGGNGYTNEYPAARIMRDGKLDGSGGGASEVKRFLIGRELTLD